VLYVKLKDKRAPYIQQCQLLDGARYRTLYLKVIVIVYRVLSCSNKLNNKVSDILTFASSSFKVIIGSVIQYIGLTIRRDILLVSL